MYDVESMGKIDKVMSIDIGNSEVICALSPIKVNHLGEIETESIKFRSIYPIFGGSRYPVLFHCYGREANNG